MEIDLPSYPALSDVDRPRQGTIGYAVDQKKPTRLFVTNGSTLMRSVNGGCSWSKVLQTTVPRSIASDSAHIYVVAGGGDRVYAYMMSGLPSSGAGQMQMWASTDGGAKFTRADSGMLPVSILATESIAVAPSDPKRVYVLGHGTSTADALVLQVSRDGGATWSSSQASISALATMAQAWVRVDSKSPDTIYVWGPKGTGQQTGVLRSTDAGATFKEIGISIGATGASSLALTHGADGKTQLLMTDGTNLYGCNADCTLQGAVTAPGPISELAFAGDKPTGLIHVASGKNIGWRVFNWMTGTARPVPVFGATVEPRGGAFNESGLLIRTATNHNELRSR
jgi:hypothetical protein